MCIQTEYLVNPERINNKYAIDPITLDEQGTHKPKGLPKNLPKYLSIKYPKFSKSISGRNNLHHPTQKREINRILIKWII